MRLTTQTTINMFYGLNSGQPQVAINKITLKLSFTDILNWLLPLLQLVHLKADFNEKPLNKESKNPTLCSKTYDSSTYQSVV